MICFQLALLFHLFRTYTVEWTGTGSDNRFEIDLYYCGSFCMEVCATGKVKKEGVKENQLVFGF